MTSLFDEAEETPWEVLPVSALHVLDVEKVTKIRAAVEARQKAMREAVTSILQKKGHGAADGEELIKRMSDRQRKALQKKLHIGRLMSAAQQELKAWESQCHVIECDEVADISMCEECMGYFCCMHHAHDGGHALHEKKQPKQIVVTPATGIATSPIVKQRLQKRRLLLRQRNCPKSKRMQLALQKFPLYSRHTAHRLLIPLLLL